ncbi:hypothetical protein NC651_025746 [Populus alba x Populus x berolinensis]|nr:hypothetical protein NC651_025746 [Populus alba x Populus x berolinensis]
MGNHHGIQVKMDHGLPVGVLEVLIFMAVSASGHRPVGRRLTSVLVLLCISSSVPTWRNGCLARVFHLESWFESSPKTEFWITLICHVRDFYYHYWDKFGF